MQKVPSEMFDWVLNTLLHTSSQELFIILLGKDVPQGKKWVKLCRTTTAFNTKSLYIISLNKKIK